ncbi:MAG: MMPL family transporter [Actinomycetota bacterium]
MSRFPALLTAAAARRPRAVLAVIAVVTVVLASFAPQSELSNDSTAFSPRNTEVEALEELRDRFDDTSTATLQMVVTGDDVVSADGLVTTTAIVEAAESSFGDSLAGASGGRAITTYLDPAIDRIEVDGLDVGSVDDATVEELQGAGFDGVPPAQADLIRALAAGDDPGAAAAGIVLIQLDRSAFADDDAIAEAQRAFIDDVDARDLPFDAAPFSNELVRAPDDSFQQEVARLFGLAALVILVVLALVLRARSGPVLSRVGAVRRSLADMALAIFGVIIAIAWNTGLGVLLGPSYLDLIGDPTPPTQIVPILLLALGVDYAIHTHGRYREELAHGRGDPTAVAGSLGRTVGVALTLSMVTTGIGFLTNLVSPLPAIRDLGVLAATGIFAVLIVDLTFLVAGRTLLDRRAARRDRLATLEIEPTETSTLARVATVGLRPAVTAPVVVLGIAGAITVGSVVAATQLDTEFSPVDFLADGDPSKDAFVALDELFSGGLGETTEVLVTGDAVLTPAAHNATAGVEAGLVGQAGIVSLDGRPDLASPVTELAAAQRVAEGVEQTTAVDAAVAAGLQPDGTIAEDGDVLTVYSELAGAFPAVDAVVSPEPVAGTEGAAVRLTVRTQSESVGVETVRTAVDDSLAPLDAAGVTAVATSDAIVNDLTIDALSDSAVSGLVITLAAVTVLLAAVYWFRSRQAGLGALVVAPVGAVVLNTFGLMWVFGIPFDPITAIVSALVVGVGVDFCIHLGERFIEDLDAADGDVEIGLRQALRHTGAALAGSATTTTLGFAVLIFGSIVPFQRLGLVTIFAMVLSLLAVVFVLPAMLVLYGRRRTADRSDDDGEVGTEGEVGGGDLVGVVGD